MTSLNRRAAGCVIFLCGIANSQSTPSIQQKSERSMCANVIALIGDVKMNCSDLTEEQKKALKDIPAILKMAVTNQNYLADIKAKLDSMSMQQPTVTNNCPNGICISGGQVDHPTVNNNLSESLPHLLGFQLIDSSDPKYHLPVEQHKETVTFRLYTDTSWSDPQFLVVCDRPCYANYMAAENPGITIHPNFRTATSENPNVTVFLPIHDRPFPEGVYFLFQVASKDDNPIKVLRVEAVHLPLRPQ
jgi:hypothetical protein